MSTHNKPDDAALCANCGKIHVNKQVYQTHLSFTYPALPQTVQGFYYTDEPLCTQPASPPQDETALKCAEEIMLQYGMNFPFNEFLTANRRKDIAAIITRHYAAQHNELRADLEKVEKAFEMWQSVRNQLLSTTNSTKAWDEARALLAKWKEKI